MWTVIGFALQQGSHYPRAFELLDAAGFARHRAPAGPGPHDPVPAAVVADLFQDPAVVTRAVFEALHAAGLGPVCVSGSHVDVRPRRPRPALAPR